MRTDKDKLESGIAGKRKVGHARAGQRTRAELSR